MIQRQNVTRRTALRSIAAIAAAVGTGGMLLSVGSSSAAATSINVTGTTLVNDVGDISFVDLNIDDFYAKWSGYDIEVAAIGHRALFKVEDGDWHELYDQTGQHEQPVLLSEMSSRGSADDGWGGVEDYASEMPDSYSRATSPSTSGYVHSAPNWRLATDNIEEHPAKSVETPAVIGQDIRELDNPVDGSTRTFNVLLKLQVWLYTFEDLDTAPIKTIGGAEVFPFGTETEMPGIIEAEPLFTVNVVNEAASTSSDGSGGADSG